MANKPIYIDLFAGCGGLSLGLHNAGWQGLFAIEKSKDAFLTLQHNLINNKDHFKWPEWLPKSNLEINEVIDLYRNQLESLQGKVDLVAGGPPCQGFSVAGRRNENDLRNKLIDSYIEFIELVKPKTIFFENVKGFTMAFKKNMDTGKRYELYVKSKLEQAGYFVNGQLVNFGDYGIPQRRTRFILVGVRKEISNTSQETADKFFTQLTENKTAFLSSKNISESTNLGDAISDLLQKNGSDQSPDTKNFKAGYYAKEYTAYQNIMRGGITTNNVVDSHRFVNHRNDIIDKFQKIINNCIPGKNIDDKFRENNNIRKHTIVLLNEKDKSPTITSLPDDYIHYCEPRVLTVREYARIQSFPDWYQFKGKYTSGGKLRTKEVPRYTQIGNAIPPLFGEQSGLVLKQLFA